jgi:hypothetical protein
MNKDCYLLAVIPCSPISTIISEELNAYIIRIDVINHCFASAILCGISQITGSSVFDMLGTIYVFVMNEG